MTLSSGSLVSAAIRGVWLTVGENASSGLSPETSEPMTTYGPFLAGMFWNAYTIVCSLISLTQKNSTAAEYERFCENPSSVTNAIVEKVFDFGRETTVKPPVIHSVSGNPSRFDADKTLRLDEAWRKQPVMWRAFVRGITMPELFRWLAR